MGTVPRSVIVLLVPLVAACTWWKASVPGGTTVEVRQGTTYPITLEDHKLFVADRPGGPVVFVNSAQHLPDEELWWCPTEQVFVSPAHGELFDADGHYFAGPAFRDLDRVGITEDARAGSVVVDLDAVRKGAPRAESEFVGVAHELRAAYVEWTQRPAGAPSEFCSNAVAG